MTKINFCPFFKSEGPIKWALSYETVTYEENMKECEKICGKYEEICGK